MIIGPFEIPYLPSFAGLLIAVVLVLMIAVFVVDKKTGLGMLFGQAYEGMLDFFGDILGENEKMWIKSFVTNMFFVILIYNLLGLMTDQISIMFGYDEGLAAFSLSKYLGFATAEHHFNIAMAIVGVLMTLGIQFVSVTDSSILGKEVSWNAMGRGVLRVFNFLYEYVPFWGKGIITIEKGAMHPAVFYPAWIVIKAFDIVISLFVGFLDIIGIIAKVISLAFRLFGNMLSGTALLTVLAVGLSGATQGRFGFEFPVLGPIILFAQGLLVACIQAFVFPLLIAIFVKVARMGDEESQAATT